MTTKFIRIDGMTCESCQRRIQAKIQSLSGVSHVTVSLTKKMAEVEYDATLLAIDSILKAVIELGYDTHAQMVFDVEPSSRSIKMRQLKMALLTMGVLLGLYYVVKAVFGLDFLNIIPVIDASLSLPILFVIGLFTSLHCVGMCGAIHIAGSILPFGTAKQRYVRPLLYNAGRVVSYTVIGGIAGLIGQVLTPSARAQGLILGLASVFLFLVGLSMLGLMPNPSRWFSRTQGCHPAKKSSSAFVTGLLNGLMPCGPLQAMQIYAVGTASLWMGALSMFLFALGTVPLMLTFGLLMNRFKGRWVFQIQRLGAALVLLLASVMFARSLGYFGFDLSGSADTYAIAELRDGTQYVEINLEAGDYQVIMVQEDIPVRFNVKAAEGIVNGCNSPLLIPAFGIEMPLVTGDNWIEFTPEEIGTIPYSCWMRMIRSQIIVVSDLSNPDNFPGN